jgi:hypothetical protein
MALPKIKKHIPLSPQKTLYDRRQELVDMIKTDGTYLPKSLLHADLDRGFLDFVKEDLQCVVSGKIIPAIDIIVTTQNWSQFVETWNFQNLDKNVEPPFITTVRMPEVKYGSNPALMWNIPNRKQYYYASVPTWDGQRKGMDVYKIPQPVPIDIMYQVKIICNRMRELNKFNQIVLEKFSSKQAYRNIKGHYIPIVMNDITDESVMDVEKRKYYIQTYSFTMLGFLIDEDEFEVAPAVSRVIQILEVDEGKKKRRTKRDDLPNPKNFDFTFSYDLGVDSYSELIQFNGNFYAKELDNISSFDVYINDDFYGSSFDVLQLNTNETLRIDVQKSDITKKSKMVFNVELL